MSNKIRVEFIKTLWGVTEDQGNAPGSYGTLFAKIKSEGFEGVETPISRIKDKKAFRAALDETGLKYVAMINTMTFPPDDTTYTDDVVKHKASLKRLVQEAKEVKPIFINSHSGIDSWTLEEAKDYFSYALQLEQEEGIPISHETHRQRVLFNPWVTRDLCQIFPTLKLTADLSHYVNVGERVFGHDLMRPGPDKAWDAALEVIAEHTYHIHARIGYEEGPQVPNPAAPEYARALEAHEKWWDAILVAQAAKGRKLITVEPEHGIGGYQQAIPFTKRETADLWRVNNWIKDRQLERMSKKAYWEQRDLTFSAQHPADMEKLNFEHNFGHLKPSAVQLAVQLVASAALGAAVAYKFLGRK